jgi:hypothetical protein
MIGDFEFKTLICFSVTSCLNILYYCSSFKCSYGKSLKFLITRSILITTLNISSMFYKFKPEKILIFGLSLVKNLFYSPPNIFHFSKKLSNLSKYLCTFSLNFYLMALSFTQITSSCTSPYFCIIRVLNSTFDLLELGSIS